MLTRAGVWPECCKGPAFKPTGLLAIFSSLRLVPPTALVSCYSSSYEPLQDANLPLQSKQGREYTGGMDIMTLCNIIKLAIFHWLVASHGSFPHSRGRNYTGSEHQEVASLIKGGHLKAVCHTSSLHFSLVNQPLCVSVSWLVKWRPYFHKPTSWSCNRD